MDESAPFDSDRSHMMRSAKHQQERSWGLKGEKRPTDVIGNAVRVMSIATGEEPEEYGTDEDGKDAAAVSMGKRGGKALAESLTAERRAEIDKKAAAKRLANRS